VRVTLANDEQSADETSRLDPIAERHSEPMLLVEVVKQTRDVNQNLGAILNRTDSVVRRQNWLTVLFILSLAVNLVQLTLGFSMQELQKSAKAELAAVDLGREELLTAVDAAKREVQKMREEMGLYAPSSAPSPR
jgi:hypothetical protein